MRAFTLRSAERQVELQEVPGAAPNEHLPAATQGFIKQILWRLQYIYLKSDNLQYNMLGRWYNCLIDQLSNVPIIIFFYNFLQNSLQKSFHFIFLFFHNSTKINSFECPKSKQATHCFIFNLSK